MEYTSLQVAPAPTETMDLSLLTSTAFSPRRSIVTPLATLAAPAKPAWPPDRMAKLQLDFSLASMAGAVEERALTATETTSTVVSETMQRG